MESFLGHNLIFSSFHYQDESWVMIKLSENENEYEVEYIKIPVAQTVAKILQLSLIFFLETKFRYKHWTPENSFVFITVVLRMLLVFRSGWWMRLVIYVLDWICPTAELRLYNWIMKQPLIQPIMDCEVVKWITWESVAFASKMCPIYFIYKLFPVTIFDILAMSVIWDKVAPERLQSKCVKRLLAPTGHFSTNMMYRLVALNTARFLGYQQYWKATCFVMLLAETYHHEMKTVFVGCFRFSYSRGEQLVFGLISSVIRLVFWILYKLLVSRRLAYVFNYISAWTRHVKPLAEYVCEEDVNSVARLLKEINPGYFSDKFLFGFYCLFMTEALGCRPHQTSTVYQYLCMLENPMNQAGEDGWKEHFNFATSLHVAVACGHYKNVAFIINRMKRNIDVNAEGTLKSIDRNPLTALMMACGTEPNEESSRIVKSLLGHPTINVNAKTENGMTALQMAFRNALDNRCRETIEILELLLINRKLNINETLEGHKTALMMAIDYMKGEDRETVVALILRHPLIDVNAVGDPSTGFMSLHHAVIQDQPKIVATLLKVPKIKINAKTNNKETPLILATRRNNPNCLQIVKILVSKKKVDVNGVDAEGYTAMWRAFHNNNHRVVEFLYNNKKFDKSITTAGGPDLAENAEDKMVKICDESEEKTSEIDQNPQEESVKREESVGKKTSSAEKCCWCCGVEDVKLYRCGGCKKAFYCGDKCIQEDWQVHGGWCIKVKEKRIKKKSRSQL